MKRNKILERVSRRRFIRNSVVAAAGAGLAPTTLSSCSEEDDSLTPQGDFGFFEGVASFDPTQSRVILWTRYTPASNEGERPTILLDVASDADFNDLVVSESVEIDTNSDYTINVDVSNLSSNTSYYYRFRNEVTNATSVTGETKTLPATGEASDFSLAVMSCANFQAGLFNAYGAVAVSEADVVVHLGDYIYEYGAGGYGTNEQTAALNRVHEPDDEIISLDEYRNRYRQYRRDPQLQRAHQLKPFICVWDDHEITNDAYRDGAQNHQPDEGDYETRKANAIQVWHEYLPARVDDNARIFRSFSIGGILDLFMLDTRIIGRERQLNLADYLTATGINEQAFVSDWMDSNRTLLGTEQRNWLMGELSASSASYQVLGSQVLMSKMFIPSELLLLTAQLAAGNPTPELLNQYNTAVSELVTIKTRLLQGDPTLSDEERARVETVLPYNLDAWDGYPAEREMIFAAATGKKLVSLAGDTHNAWNALLTDAGGNKVGTEFATSSVSSPGFEAVFGDDPQVLDGLEQAFALLIDDLSYLNASQRGYVLATFSNSEARAEWRFINSLLTEDSTTVTGHTATEA
jgi:alkaline phosphatase D